MLTPHVYWAQRHRELYLRVELSDVQVKAVTRGALASGTHQEPPGPTRTHPDSLTLCPIAPRRPCSAPTGWGLALVETHLQTQAWRTTP